jgi:hypothetical protein
MWLVNNHEFLAKHVHVIDITSSVCEIMMKDPQERQDILKAQNGKKKFGFHLKTNGRNSLF